MKNLIHQNFALALKHFLVFSVISSYFLLESKVLAQTSVSAFDRYVQAVSQLTNNGLNAELLALQQELAVLNSYCQSQTYPIQGSGSGGPLDPANVFRSARAIQRTYCDSSYTVWNFKSQVVQNEYFSRGLRLPF